MSDERSPQEYQRGRWTQAENMVMSALTRVGLIPNTYLMTTTGRKTGRRRSNPVTIVEHDKQRWLVAPYGSVSWVHNARAAGEVRLTRRGSTRRFAVREVSAEEAGPILKSYVTIAPATRNYFTADMGAPIEAFVAEANGHPVFKLIPMPAA
jgi:deazaflavin-dependent oxidoreductase (nitroreductase family)